MTGKPSPNEQRRVFRWTKWALEKLQSSIFSDGKTVLMRAQRKQLNVGANKRYHESEKESVDE